MDIYETEKNTFLKESRTCMYEQTLQKGKNDKRMLAKILRGFTG